jgi:bifunctional non-homologous end joining protein LigD
LESRLRVTEELQPPFAAALEQAASRGFEGLMLKLRGSAYEHRRSRAWLKLKAHKSQELAIVGFLPGEGSAAGGIGALLLAVNDPARGGLVFAGKVGTGFSAKQRAELLRELARDAVDTPRVQEALRLRGAIWVEPRLVAQVRFTEWTADGKLRHPAFQGLRADKTPAECVREVPAAPPKEVVATEGRAKGTAPGNDAKAAPNPRAPPPEAVKLTHPERVLYPRENITKQDIADYYAAVSGPLLRALAGRPLVLVHWNEGIESESWIQQDVRSGRGRAEEWLTIVDTPTAGREGKPGRTVGHLVADSPAALRWLAQMSVLELHMWHSRVGSLSTPDWVVFDLDPADGKDISQAIEVALVLRGMFERLGIPSIPKTTGKRGLHLLVPLAPGHTYADAESFALRVAETVVQQVPDVTLERSKAKRHGRLYLDCLQNAQGKTIVAPYSPRGVPGAPVSTPLRWSEVAPGLDPGKFTVRTVPHRLAEVGDLFAPALENGVRLPRFR